VVAVDVGSTDRTADLLAQAPSVSQVVTLPAETGFAEAVHAGVDAAPAHAWVWVLHDDSAPDPDALGVLLQSAADQPSVAVWGPKVLGWDEPRRLLEVGVSISRSGTRYTGLERGEQDQGQFDGQRDVLAVGSAGMLVRRDVWTELGGFDRALHRFREDVDLGWRVNLAGHRVTVDTRAVVHHAEAISRGRRPGAGRDPLVDDRVSAVHTVVANSSASALLLRWPWLLLQTLVRALVFVLGKSPREAAAEMAAVAGVLLRPDRVFRARRMRRRVVPSRRLRSFFPPKGLQLRQTMEGLAGVLSLPDEAASGVDAAPSTILESGPADDDIDSFVAAGTGRLRRLLRRPGVLLFLGLLLVQLIAWRGLYRGGVLHGGALLPVPTGASDIWQAYTAAWHPVTLGSDTMAHPSSAVLGLLATLLFGHASWVVPLLSVLAAPLAGVLVYQVTRSLALSVRLRLWLGVAYALNPVLLAATAQGRWTTVLAALLLPVAAVAMSKALLGGSVRAGAASVLVVTALLSIAPTLLLPLLVVLAVALVRLRRRRRWLAVMIAVLPLLVLAPWWSTVVADPTVLLLEPGVQLTADDEAPWQAIFLDPGGWWSLPWWLGVGVLVAVLAAVLRSGESRPVRFGLALAAVAASWALLLEAVAVTPSTATVPVAPWSGSVLVLAAGAALLAVASAARGAGRRLSQSAFTWRQPALVLVTALAVASPLVWGMTWISRGASDPLTRGDANPLPAFVRAQSALPEQIRTLVLRPEDGRLAYTVLRSRDAQWGDVETAPSVEQMQGMDEVVSDLASGRGAAPVDDLTERAVQYVLVVPPVADTLEQALDSAPGLLRIANPGESALWRIQQETGRARLLTSDGERAVLASEVPGDPSSARVEVPASDADRVLELAELADDGWRAVVTSGSGSQDVVDRSPSDWAERFVVGAGASTVSLSVDDPLRRVLLWAQLIAVAVLVLVALPGRSRHEEEAV
jgi:hypothetical protein